MVKNRASLEVAGSVLQVARPKRGGADGSRQMWQILNTDICCLQARGNCLESLNIVQICTK